MDFIHESNLALFWKSNVQNHICSFLETPLTLIFKTQEPRPLLPISTDDLDKLFFLVLGALLTWVLQQYRVARSEDVALVNEHIKDIEKFCDAARDYWLKAAAATVDEEIAAAAKVRAAHAATTLLYQRMTEACAKNGQLYQAKMRELFDVATGQNFESASRKIEPVIAISIQDTAAQLIHVLRTCRQDIISLKRLLINFFAVLRRIPERLAIDFKS
ncbi:hypothetical protein ACXHXG_30320 [Rhizobium sp. LEGMi198b]